MLSYSLSAFVSTLLFLVDLVAAVGAPVGAVGDIDDDEADVDVVLTVDVWWPFTWLKTVR